MEAIHPQRPIEQEGGDRDAGSGDYHFDRRRSPRQPAQGLITMLHRSHDLQAYRQRIHAVQLRDLSETGVGLRTGEPVGVDEPVAVCFPPHGADRGFDLLGHVVRCESDGEGYRLGIQLDPRPAA